MAGLDRDKLRALIERSGKTARALSLEVGDNAYLIRDILSGKSTNPRMDTLQRVAEVLGAPLASLQMGDGHQGAVANLRTIDRRTGQVVPRFLPVRYRVQAGHWIEVDQQAQDWEGPANPIAPDPRYGEFTQWLERVVGDSVDLVIADGGFAHVVDIIDMGYSPRTGDYVVVERRRNGGMLRERTIKQVLIQKGVLELWPRSTNPKWREAIRLKDEGMSDEIEVEVVGLVIGAYSSFARG